MDWNYIYSELKNCPIHLVFLHFFLYDLQSNVIDQNIDPVDSASSVQIKCSSVIRGHKYLPVRKIPM